MVWWLWMLLGLALLAAEMATPGGFFIFFFGAGALVVGALAGLGLLPSVWLQWLLFPLISVGTLVVLRPLLRQRLERGPGRPVDSLVGESGTVLEDVGAGGVGRIEVRGASWSARTAGSAALGRGQRCVVERVDGLTLWVRPE